MQSDAAQHDNSPTAAKETITVPGCVGTFTLGELAPVLENHDLWDYLNCCHDQHRYQLPVDLAMLSRTTLQSLSAQGAEVWSLSRTDCAH
ncbi:hypothetical protein [Stenotrophomonas sp. B1-1]|uniref:hypothetical protein n=1 Tax=Stenotrophomonas sp. B1-1 TaxID=2710648 RepID=UPI0013D97ED3|nr:hypothetical protein [Stenotrophomonas sp. B1-1]